MEKRTVEVFEALFKLEEIRQIIRDALPTGLDTEEELLWNNKLSELKESVNRLETGLSRQHLGKITAGIDVRNREENYINIQPMQLHKR